MPTELSEKISTVRPDSGLNNGWGENIPYSEGIDLSELFSVMFNTLIQKRKTIFGITVFFAVGGLFLNLCIPNTYEAYSHVTNIYTRPRIELIETVNKNSASGTGSIISDFSELLKSGDVVTAVISELNTQGFNKRAKLSSEMLLRSMRPRQDGDILGIHVRWNEPDLAAAIANIWAKEFVFKINRLYGIGVIDDDKSSVQQEYQRSIDSFRQTNDRWVNFVRQDNIEALELQVKNIETIRNALFEAQQAGVFARVADGKRTLEVLLKQRQELIRKLDDARSLSVQIKSEGTASIGSQMALMLLKVNVYASSDQQYNLDFSPSIIGSQIDQKISLSEVNELTKVLETRLIHLNDQILASEKKLHEVIDLANVFSGPNVVQQIESIEKKLLVMRGEIAKKKNLRKELETQMLLAHSIYQAVSSKWQNLLTASNLTANEVRLASIAYPPSRPISPGSPFKYAFWAALIGFFSSWFFLGIRYRYLSIP